MVHLAARTMGVKIQMASAVVVVVAAIRMEIVEGGKVQLRWLSRTRIL